MSESLTGTLEINFISNRRDPARSYKKTLRAEHTETFNLSLRLFCRDMSRVLQHKLVWGRDKGGRHGLVAVVRHHHSTSGGGAGALWPRSTDGPPRALTLNPCPHGKTRNGNANRRSWFDSGQAKVLVEKPLHGPPLLTLHFDHNHIPVKCLHLARLWCVFTSGKVVHLCQLVWWLQEHIFSMMAHTYKQTNKMKTVPATLFQPVIHKQNIKNQKWNSGNISTSI